MSVQEVVKFYTVVEADKVLRERLISVDREQFAEKAVELGKEIGLHFSSDDVRKLTSGNFNREDVWLSDVDLSRSPNMPHPCFPSGIGALDLLALAANVHNAKKATGTV